MSYATARELSTKPMIALRSRLALAAFALGMISAGSAHACEVSGRVLVRDSGSVLLLATAGVTLAPTGVRRAEVLDGRGAGVDPIAPGSAVFVPWTHRSDCKPVPWPSDAPPWSPPTSPAVYIAVPRTQADWIGGVRTFDVFVAQREPQWSGPVNSYGWSGGPASMTPAEYLTFLAAFPTTQEVEAKSPAIERRLAAWESTHPTEAAREPALTMLAALRRMLAALEATDLNYSAIPLPSELRDGTASVDQAKGWIVERNAYLSLLSLGLGIADVPWDVREQDLDLDGTADVLIADPHLAGSGGFVYDAFLQGQDGLRYIGRFQGRIRTLPFEPGERVRMVVATAMGSGEARVQLAELRDDGLHRVAEAVLAAGDSGTEEGNRLLGELMSGDVVSQGTLERVFGLNDQVFD